MSSYTDVAKVDDERRPSTPRAPAPFLLSVPEAAIDDLRTRLRSARLPDRTPGEAWAYGSDVDYMEDLVKYTPLCPLQTMYPMP